MHIGHSIRALRELQGMKQETLGQMLKISQQTVSKIEQSAHINERTVERIAGALGVPPAIIYQYDDQKVVEAITAGALSNEQPAYNGQCNFCPTAKIIIELYERLLQAEAHK